MRITIDGCLERHFGKAMEKMREDEHVPDMPSGIVVYNLSEVYLHDYPRVCKQLEEKSKVCKRLKKKLKEVSD